MKLIKTTVFRVALQFAASFALLSIVTMLSVYYFTIHEIEAQVDAELLQELNELKPHYEKNNIGTLSRLMVQRAEYGEHFRHYYALATRDNKMILGSEFLLTGNIIDQVEKQGVLFVGISELIGDDDHEVYVKTAQLMLSSDLKLVVGQAKNALNELREHVFIALAYAIVATLIIGLMIGSYMGRSVLFRINRIDKGMASVIESDFTHLLTVPEKEDEFQALTIKLNAMLTRIEKLISGMRQVTDNVAHDLRSPLTRMRNRIEVTLLQDREGDEYREVMQKVIGDCDELLRTFNSLLAITQAESGVFREDLEQIALNELVDELAELYCAVAEDSGLDFIWKNSDEIFITGRRHSLAQAINNLLENAIKYTPKGGVIEIKVGLTDNAVPYVLIVDTGPGIPKKNHERVLERFYRLDNARAKPGNGLGLSLVDAVVKLHGAQLVFTDNKPGLKVEIRFLDGTCDN